MSLPQVVRAEPAFAPFITADSTTWSYLDDDTFPSEGAADPLSWTKPDFDDSPWLTGVGAFGGKVSGGVQTPVYEANRIARTQLTMNAPGRTERVRTYFFRAGFELTGQQIANIGVVKGNINYDDGMVVYINGTEVARGDVDPGMEGLNYAPIGGTGFDTTGFSFGRDLLVPGGNTIAVELHQDRSGSSDIWFNVTELAALSLEEARIQPTRIVLTPTEDPTTSQNISFQGAEVEDVTGRVEIKPTADGGALKKVNAALQPGSVSNGYGHFSATVTGLKPNTEYTYRVSSNGKWSNWKAFETADPKEREFSYVYYGDAQVGLDSTWPKVVNAARAKAPHAIGSVHAGDLIDTSSNDLQWDNWFRGMESAAAGTNVIAAPGNHEYVGDPQMTAWRAHFEYPINSPNDTNIGTMLDLAKGDTDVARQYRALFDHWAEFAAETVYYTDYQGVRFITVNATQDSTALRPEGLAACTGSECPSSKVTALWTQFQAAWLDHVLTDSTSKWNVATFHQPVYSTSAGRSEKILRDTWIPVFEKHNIDLVQMGHDHTYARGFTNTTATDTPGVTNGPVYIVSNSGAKHYVLETDERNVWTNNGATQVQKAQNLTTYQVIDVAEDTLTYRSYIAEINGTGIFWRNGQQIDADQFKVGDLWDEFTVHKTDNGQKAVVEQGLPVPEFEDLSEIPAFTTDLPAQTPVRTGERAALSVSVDSGAPATFQWQLNTGAGWADVTGETSARLALGRVDTADLGHRYRVVVTAGSRTITSAVTVLTDAGQGPVFTTNLRATTAVGSGNDVVLRVAAEADSRVTYQWQRLAASGWVNMVGRTGPILELKAVRTNGARYRVVATAGSRSVASASTTMRVSKKASQVTIRSVKALRGKPAAITLRSNQAGTVRITVSQGKKRWHRTIQVGTRTTSVKLGKLSRDRKQVTVRVTLTPTSVDHLPATATKKVRAR